MGLDRDLSQGSEPPSLLFGQHYVCSYQDLYHLQVGGDHFLRNNRHLAGTKVRREVDAPNVVHLVDEEDEEEDERIFQQNKRPRRDNGEFSQDVLQSARLYIKSVS